VNAAAESVGVPALELREGPSRDAGRQRGWLVRRALIVADLVGLWVAFLVAELAFSIRWGSLDHFDVRTESLLFLLTLPGWIAGAKVYGLYDRDEERAEHSTLDDLVGVLHLTTVGAWLFFLGAKATEVAEPSLVQVTVFWAASIAGITALRVVARMLCRRSASYVQNTVIVGTGDVGRLVARKIRQHREYGMSLVGFVDADARNGSRDGVRLLGTPEELPELVGRLGVERVIVAFADEPPERTIAVVRRLKALNVQVDIVPRFFEALGTNVSVHALEGMPLVGLPTLKRFPFSTAIKRALDVAGAALAIVLVAPLLGLIAWRIRRDSPGPVLFRQVRLGQDLREFTMLKFRTMRVDVDDSQHRDFIAQTMNAHADTADNGLFKLSREDAVTPFGRFLRRTSLDELPQLFNVLRGQMSLVGPRPCLAYETDHFAPHHFERFLVPPGITGLWQVTARAHSTFGEALDMDVAYARGWSLALDFWLLLKTPFHLRRGTA
jgi:exopolysaccharide biosynthesis polyprenyl glycosylphosphotransferase